MLKLVYFTWLSEERDKYIWEDLYDSSWDEIIGRMYLLKANASTRRVFCLISSHEEVENGNYQEALADFEQALLLFAKDDVISSYYVNAMSDKALTQCFLRHYEAALETINQTLAMSPNNDDILDNRGAILVLAGAYSEALDVIHAQLEKNPQDSYLRFTLATCLLHMERYSEAIAAYEQVIAKEGRLENDAGLIAARQGRQPDWASL
jgi:tetratricopeptide (TPR) repeat protein